VFTQISAGGTHACGITGGMAYCWGNDSTFQLGGGDALRVNSSTPIPVQGGSFNAITTGRKHTCALTAAGAAYCWGDNSFGQLGMGAVRGAVDTPAAVAGGLAFAQLSARGDNTCGLTSAGTIYCWGANESGQTGLAPSGPVATPNLVAGTGYTFVSVGGRDTTRADGPMGHVCALSGTMAKCWGSNRYGQLGRGTINDGSFPTPAPVPGVFTALSAGTRSTCAVAADGARCWGSSIYGATGGPVQALGIDTPTLTRPPE
jgi:serine/threonine-protein kinase